MVSCSSKELSRVSGAALGMAWARPSGPSSLPKALQAVQQGRLADILGFAFDAQAFELAQRVRRHQGRRAISARHRIRDIQFVAQLIHVVLGLLDLRLPAPRTALPAL